MDETKEWRVATVKRLSDPVAAEDVARGIPAMSPRPTSRRDLFLQWAGFIAMLVCAILVWFAVILWLVGVI